MQCMKQPHYTERIVLMAKDYCCAVTKMPSAMVAYRLKKLAYDCTAGSLIPSSINLDVWSGRSSKRLIYFGNFPE